MHRCCQSTTSLCSFHQYSGRPSSLYNKMSIPLDSNRQRACSKSIWLGNQYLCNEIFVCDFSFRLSKNISGCISKKIPDRETVAYHVLTIFTMMDDLMNHIKLVVNIRMMRKTNFKSTISAYFWAEAEDSGFEHKNYQFWPFTIQNVQKIQKFCPGRSRWIGSTWSKTWHVQDIHTKYPPFLPDVREWRC